MSKLFPVVCDPIFRTKPWGGRELIDRFDKPFSTDEPVGESWELVSLPGADSVVRDGLLAGKKLSQLVQEFGPALVGNAPLADGGFPLLIKFLDAREHLSVQVHPKPKTNAGWEVGIKHEAWYVLHADPGALVFIGFKEGVTPEDVQKACGTPAFKDLMASREARVGDCFYLPSGTVHALGGGLVVAEVQTPSDTTYRFYDWDRVGLDGKPRELHLADALANTRYDVAMSEVAQDRPQVRNELGDGKRVTACHAFTMDHYQAKPATYGPLSAGTMRIWIILDGFGMIGEGDSACRFGRGDTVLIPADCELPVHLSESTELIESKIP